MPDYRKDIERLKNPENIVEAVYASSPYVLRTAFERDPTIARLVRGGSEVVTLVRRELAQASPDLQEITLASLVYVLEKIDPAAAAETVKPILRDAMQKPGPFFVNFAAHALRRHLRLPTRPLEMVYRKAEVLEALK